MSAFGVKADIASILTTIRQGAGNLGEPHITAVASFTSSLRKLELLKRSADAEFAFLKRNKKCGQRKLEIAVKRLIQDEKLKRLRERLARASDEDECQRIVDRIEEQEAFIFGGVRIPPVRK